MNKKRLVPILERGERKLHKIRNQQNLRYTVLAIGVDEEDNVVVIKTNINSNSCRPFKHHAEMRVWNSPRGYKVRKIYLMRLTVGGRIGPIHPCQGCKKVLEKVGVEVVPVEMETAAQILDREVL